MVMGVIWTAMAGAAVLFGFLSGQEQQVAAAAMEGAESAVKLALSLVGPLCLWTGVMEVMGRCGLTEGLSRLLRPVLSRLYPGLSPRGQAIEDLSANMAANLLGLGSAATPMGLRAARGLERRSPGYAGDDLCRLIVCNTASIQLLPTTAAALRSAEGCTAPFDIVPAVWLASVLSVGAGLGACTLFARLWRE